MSSNQNSVDLFVRVTAEFAKEIDRRRGRMSRATYIRTVLEREIGLESRTRVRRRPGHQESSLVDDLTRIANKGQGPDAPRSQKEA